MNKLVSIIIPAFNEINTIRASEKILKEILEENNISFEIIFIDDGSSDGSWECILNLASYDSRIRGIKFSRNFGKEAAIMAGLKEAKGEGCVVIDCDLQHPPQKIIEMYKLWDNGRGYEIIEGVKSYRGKESTSKRLSAHLFYKLINYLTSFDLNQSSDFKFLDRKAINALVKLNEKNSFFRALSAWIGFKTATVTFEVQDRIAGSSKWNTKKLIHYALRNITSFSTAPMQLVTFMGILMLLTSIVMGGIALFQKITGQALGGFTTIIILLLFSNSMLMISLGIIGYYIARIFEEVKNRPLYIVSEKC